MNSVPYLGTLFIVAAPSGGGKTSLVKKLVSEMANIEISISHTTREQRTGEKNGVDYFFVSEEAFTELISTSAFVEYACVFNHLYGTSKEQILNRLSAGIDVILDIDWQGAQQIKRAFTNAVSVFVIPPSLEVLEERLRLRQRDKKEVILERMHKAQDELSHYSEFDYLVVNDEFEKAASELKAIVLAHRLRMERQVNQQHKILSFLLA